MSFGLSYKLIDKYKISCRLVQPLHIGNGDGSETVLVRTSDGTPFAQASGIAGALRDFYKSQHPDGTLFGDRKKAESSFGSSGSRGAEAEQADSPEGASGEFEESSRIRVTDGEFVKDTLILERRPHIRINGKTGTVLEEKTKGTDNKSGQYYAREYIGAGAGLVFYLYTYRDCREDGVPAVVNEILKGLDAGQIRLGGKKTIGCGAVTIEKALYKSFDMTSFEDRRKWASEDLMDDTDYEKKIDLSSVSLRGNTAFRITVTGRTEGTLLVKSITVPEYFADSPDSVNIQNAAGDYIVPGSSFKGNIRSQMKKIAGYLEKKGQIPSAVSVMEGAFGREATVDDTGSSGSLFFEDAVVGDRKVNDRAEISHRIHIDKFTGGTIEKALFSEKDVSGDMTFRVSILNHEACTQFCGLLLLALRDLSIGRLSIGSGASVGKGFIEVDTIEIEDLRKEPDHIGKACIHIKSGEIEDQKGLIAACLRALAEGGRV